MQKRNYRDYRHTESLTLFLLKDEASHTQTRTNKTPKEIKEKGKTFLLCRPGRPARSGRIAAKWRTLRLVRPAPCAVRPLSSMSLSDSFRALVARRLSRHSSQLQLSRHSSRLQLSRHSSRLQLSRHSSRLQLRHRIVKELSVSLRALFRTALFVYALLKSHP